jgi:hypothetical protein
MAVVYRFRFRVRRRTTANWVSSNEVLLDSEIGIESDLLRRSKMGDGVTGWNALPFYTPGLIDHTALASIADGETLVWDASAGMFLPGSSGGGGSLGQNLQDLDAIAFDEGDMIYFAGSAGLVALPPGTTGQVLRTAGPGAPPQWATPGVGDSTALQVDTYATPGSFTWTKPAGAKVVEVITFGGGGGGGGGAKRATANYGPGGGGGGARMIVKLKAADCGSTETVTVGAGGTGGAGNTVDVGTVGTAGGDSSFGALVIAYGGGAGAGGTAGGTTSGGGGAAVVTGGSALGGGAGGGSASGGQTQVAGAPGGFGHQGTTPGAGGAASGGNGGNGTSPTTIYGAGAGGGGGATSNVAGVSGGNGGNGGRAAGGGGGGTCSGTGTRGGNGGNGGDGFVAVITYF